MKELLQQKEELRKKMLLLLREQHAISIARKSQQLLELLDHLSLWQQSSSVALYAPLPVEVDLRCCLKNAKKDQRFFFPRIVGNELVFYEWYLHAPWKAGPYGLQEPDPKHWRQASPSEVDLILVPGVAFDLEGRRLGRGGGFYDRFLSNPSCKAFKIGIAWPWQIVEQVPAEAHDIEMDTVMTVSN